MNSKDFKSYWKTNVLIISVLLAVWALVACFGGILFIEQLNEFKIGKLPLGFWIANQGSMLTFVVLILIYALAMDWLDRRYLNSGSTGGRDSDH